MLQLSWSLQSLSPRQLQLPPHFSLSDSTFLWVSHIFWWEKVSRNTLKIPRRNCILQPWLLKSFSFVFLSFSITWFLLDYFFCLLAQNLNIWSSFEEFLEFVFQLGFYFHVHLLPFLLPTISFSVCLFVFAFLLMFYISLRILALVFQLGFSSSHRFLAETWLHTVLYTIFLQLKYLDTEAHLCTCCNIIADSKCSFCKTIRPCWQKKCPLKWVALLCRKCIFFPYNIFFPVKCERFYLWVWAGAEL